VHGACTRAAHGQARRACAVRARRACAQGASAHGVRSRFARILRMARIRPMRAFRARARSARRASSARRPRIARRTRSARRANTARRARSTRRTCRTWRGHGSNCWDKRTLGTTLSDERKQQSVGAMVSDWHRAHCNASSFSIFPRARTLVASVAQELRPFNPFRHMLNAPPAV